MFMIHFIIKTQARAFCNFYNMRVFTRDKLHRFSIVFLATLLLVLFIKIFNVLGG